MKRNSAIEAGAQATEKIYAQVSANVKSFEIEEEPAWRAEERVVQCLQKNAGNTLPMVEALRLCDAPEPRPYRDVEEDLYVLPIMHRSNQTPHTLCELLVKAGGLEKIVVEEELPEQIDWLAEAEDEEMAAALEDAAEQLQPQELEDQPIDYLLALTCAGKAALEMYDPARRFARLVAAEPESYLDAYKQTLILCKPGIKFPQLESAMGDHPAMRAPKRIYPGYFVSKLETVNGIAWENSQWLTTEHGLSMIEFLSEA